MEKKEEVIIVYNKFCPFAQRALITALQKEIPAVLKKVSLGEKGSYFKETYGRAYGRDPASDGKVPILVHNQRVLTESEPVCWYLAEQFNSGSSLIPDCNFEKAKMRIMISRFCGILIQLFNKPKLNQVVLIEDYQKQLRQGLRVIDAAIEGQYFLGDNIRLIDVLIYPWFQRWVILEHYYGVGLTEQNNRILKWLKNMNQRKSIIETKKLTNQEYYITRSQKMMAPKL